MLRLRNLVNNHHRQSIRLRDYDYSTAGGYFVTLCAFQRECLFGDVVGVEMRLSEIGEIVQNCWGAIRQHCPHVTLDNFIIMPNHFHGILFINDGLHVGAQHAAPLPMDQPLTLPNRTTGVTTSNVLPGSLGAIIRSFKSAATKQINTLHDNPGARVWQRNYYEHIIRGERDLDSIRRYIVDNPAKWADDENHPVRLRKGTLGCM